MQWWKEAAIPVRLVMSAILFLIFTASFFASRELWSQSASMDYAEYTEFDAFSQSQKGSMEDAYFQLTHIPLQGEKR